MDTEQLTGSVLIIDDDPSMVHLMRRIFERDGCKVAEALDGKSGLELFEQVHPDIVLLDVMMPGLTGFEVCEQLRALPGGERTAIILVTSLNDEQAVERAFEVGADDYITKPMRWSVLRHRLHRLLITKRAEEYAYFQASLLQHVHNAVVATDQIGFITYWNHSANILFQWDSAEVIGRHIGEVMLSNNSGRTDEIRGSAEGMGSWIVQVQTNAEGMGSWDGEIVSQRKDGQAFPVHLTMAPTRNALDQIIGFVGVITDITERKRAEQALQEREASFRHLFANNPHPMWVRDTQTLRFLDVNAAAVIRYGYSREEFLAMQITDIYLAEDMPALLTQLKVDQNIAGQWRHRLKNGTVIDVEISSHILEFGGRKAVLAVAQDITERKQAEEALTEERNLLRTLIDTISDYIFVKDRQSRFIINNRADLTSLDLAMQADATGKTDFDFFSPEQAVSFFADEQTLMQTGQPVLKKEEPATNHSTNQVEWYETTKVPLRDRNGQIIGLVGISHDITEIKNTQARLTEERNLLRTLIDTVPDFIFVKDNLSRYIINNRAHLKTLGVATQVEATGKTDFDFFPQEEAAGFFADDQALIQTKQPLLNREEPATNRSTNAVEWHDTTKAPLRDRNGQIIGLVGISHDITEFKKTQERLTEERNLLRTLIDTVPDHIFIKDRQSRFVINNRAHLMGMGLVTQDDAIGKSDFDFYRQEEAAGFFAIEQKLIESGQPLLSQEEVAIDPALGYLKWRNTSKAPLRDTTGRIIGLVGISNDITELKQAQEKLTEERNLLRTLIDTMPNNFFIKDRQSRYIINNRSHLDLLGLATQDAATGKTDFDFFSQQEAESFFADEQTLMQTERPLLNKGESVTDPATGRAKWLNTTKVPLHDRKGQLVGLVGMNQDITELKQAQEKLTEERNVLHTMIDNLPDYIYVKDAEERFVLSNLAHAQSVHVLPDELIGKTAFDFFPPELAVRYHEDDSRVIRTGQSLINVERTTIDSAGQPKYVLTSKVALRDQEGKVVGLVGLSHDITERKRAEDVILHLASIVESSDDGILGISLDGIIMSWNPGAEGIFGYSRDEILGHSISILSPADRLDEVPPMFEIIKGGEPVRHFETLQLRKDGKKIDVAFTISPLKDSTGTVTGLSAILRDITDRKQTERALSEYRYELEMLVEQRTTELSTANQTLRQEIVERNWADKALRRGEEQLRRITDNMLDMIWQTDIKGIIQYASPSCWNVLGYTPEALIGHSIYEQMDPDHLDTVMIALQTVGRVEYRYRDASGHYIWLESLSNLLFEDDTEAKGIILASRDITERKGTQGALQQSEERFRQLAENIDQVFWMSSAADGQMIYVSQAYERMWGRSLQSLYAQPMSFLEAVHPEDRERISIAQEKLSFGTYDEEYRIVQGTGTTRWIHSKAFPIHNEQGQVYRIAGISEDVTERKRVEQELQELNQLKTDFLSTAAHELRTPLTSIRGFSEILLTRELDETRRKRYLGLIDEQSTHLGQIIDDLLNLSRLEAKHNLTLDLESINMEALVDKVLPPFLESNPSRHVVLEGLQDCPPIVGDPFRISQVVRNLVSNAFKYSPNGGTITIRGQMAPDCFQLSIQDSGIGMTEEQQIHLFEKFYRADASNLAIHGTGLGLAISKLIIGLHGGQIWAESEYHVGTTFCFTLPYSDLTSGN